MRYPVGYRFMRRFRRTWHRGEVIALDSDEEHEPLYVVKYEDGDQEDLHLSELKRCNQVHETQAATRRSTRNSQRAAL